MDLKTIVASPWSWIVLGGVLLALEIGVPGASLLWLGIAAVVTGLISFSLPLSWESKLVVFGMLSIISVMLGRRLSPKPGEASESPFLNRRTASYVGRVFVLERAIDGGAGVVRIEDTLWRVVGPDLPAGASVRVVSVDGPVLAVEPA